MGLSELPPELLLKVTSQLPLHDHACCLRTSRRWQSQLSPALYARLLPLERSTRHQDAYTSDSQHIRAERRLTRKYVIQWAVEHGVVEALRAVDEMEPLSPVINTLTFQSPRLQALGEPETPLLLLHLASLHGQSHVLRFLLDEGADATRTVGPSLLPIHFATTGAVVDMLVACGNPADGSGNTTPLIHSLICRADATAVSAFVKRGANPDYVTPAATTAAQVAVDSGNVGALQALIQAGIDATQPLPSGQSLLWRATRFAASLTNIEDANTMVRFLLDNGASVHTGGLESHVGPKNRPCYTPCLFAAVLRPGTASVVQTMLEKGANPHEVYSMKRAPDTGILHISGYETAFAPSLAANLVGSIVQGQMPRVDQPRVSEDALQKLRLLVEYGCSIDSEIEDVTPLHYCLRQRSSRCEITRELIPHLIALGANVSHTDGAGSQPLHILTGHFYAKLQHHWYSAHSLQYRGPSWPNRLTNLMQLMVDKGADVNARDAQGRTPLMLLCRVPPTICTALLIRHLLGYAGVDANAVDNDGCSALHHIVGVSGPGLTDESCWRLQIVLSHGRDPVAMHRPDRSGRTPLHLLLEHREKTHGHPGEDGSRRCSLLQRRALTILIRGGADTRARMMPASGPTPFHSSRYDVEDVGTAHVFGPDAVRMLVPGSGDQGDAPIHLACQSPDPVAILEVLLRHGAAADVNLGCRRQKMTPLMMLVGYQAVGKLSLYAAQRAMTLLLSAGADIGIRDVDGRTAWDLFLELNKSNHLWTLEPYIEGIMPPMSDSERQKVLGLGVSNKPSLNI